MPPRKKKSVEVEVYMTLGEATEYLKKMDEWGTLRNMDSDTVIRWACYLKHHEDSKKTKNENNNHS